MMFNKIDFSKIILNQYGESYFVWIGFFILGVLLVKYADNLTTTTRAANKMVSAGSGLIAISVVVHLGVIWSLFVS